MFQEIHYQIMDLTGSHWTLVRNAAAVLESDIQDELAVGSLTEAEAQQLNQELAELVTLYGQEN